MRTSLIVLVLITAAAQSWAMPAQAIPDTRLRPLAEAALQSPVEAPPTPRIAPSGLPVPRWVSVRARRLNVRRGPSFDQDVIWTYVRVGVPVEIIAEFDTWRRIRDASGDTGWVKAAMLESRRNVIVTGRVNTAMLAAAKADANVVAYAAPGLQAQLLGCDGEWCEISARGFDGYVTRDRLWGVYGDETFH
ncbi:MAG: SH3 domain-containing protein [Alphaproteobacteria bacterium]|nr:SH3 domain-containing protein [Alphaproteobacteria bacterium]